jgi:hypothetical protein
VFHYRATEPFWKHFHALSSAQKQSIRAVWEIFKIDPFDARLGTHKIHRLSAIYGETIYAVRIAADLRVIFAIRQNVVWSLDVGSHDIYKS